MPQLSAEVIVSPPEKIVWHTNGSRHAATHSPSSLLTLAHFPPIPSLHKFPLTMNYPLHSEYCEAVKYAADNFKELSHLTPVLDTNGNPVMSSGNFAVVFRMHDAKANKDVAVRCFLREQEGRAESYRLIAQELAYTPVPFSPPSAISTRSFSSIRSLPPTKNFRQS